MKLRFHLFEKIKIINKGDEKMESANGKSA